MVRSFIMILFAVLLSATSAYSQINLDYKINLSGVIENAEKELTAEILITPDNSSSSITLHILHFKDIIIDGQPLRTKAGIVNIDLQPNKTSIVKFTKIITDDDYIKNNFLSIERIAPNVITPDNMIYNFDITLPAMPEYYVVMSNDTSATVNTKSARNYTATFSKPLEQIDIIASADFKTDSVDFNDIKIATYFFEKDAHLAKTYLDHTAKYIADYEKYLDVKYPYDTFSIVESKLPSGYAMPTYTSITEMVLARPFILTTSLPHEILHQWFGVAIGIKDNSNWAEALTSYLSDHFYRETAGEDVGYRKNILYDYMLYVQDNESNKLSNFKYNDSKISQTIGYGKGSFLLHMIRMQEGKELFERYISAFTKKYLFKTASWDDLINIFNDKKYLDPIADFMLNGAKMINISDISTELIMLKSEYILKVDFTRDNGPAVLNINYTIHDGNDKIVKTLKTNLGKNEFNITLPSANAKVMLDENYDIFRSLTADEIAVNFSAFFAAKDIIGVADSFACDDVMRELGIKTIYQSTDVTYKIASSNNIFVCGKNNPVLQTMLATRTDNMTDLNISSYAVYHNPFMDNKFIMIAENPNEQTMRSLKHYGSFDFIKFENNKVTDKLATKSMNGILLYERTQDSGIVPMVSQTMQQIINDASNDKVIFIGESHDNYAHHLNQLEIIKELYKKNKNIAVGFEMVQRQFQPALDKFVAGDISEKEFLKAVDYYNRWSFDYKLYAPIFKFLQDNKIKGIALNIDGAITRKISRSGYESLSNEEKGQLPASLNLGNRKYFTELKYIFGAHAPKSMSDKTFTNFFIAQNIWDEVMAESIYKYTLFNPKVQVIVIAGGVHARKDTGIPARYERLSGQPTFVILQDDDINPTTSDRVLFTSDFSLPKTVILGVMLNDSNKRVTVTAIDNNSIAAESLLHVNDIIQDCNMIAISDIVDFKYLLTNLAPDDKLQCTVNRKGNRMNVDFDLTAARNNMN